MLRESGVIQPSVVERGSVRRLCKLGVSGSHQQQLRVGFVIEQTLGHRAHSQTLQQGIEGDSDVRGHWEPVLFDADTLPWSLPLIRHNWSVRGSLRAQQSLRRLVGKGMDALFIHTFTIALLAAPYVARVPTVLSTDATPENYDQVGCWYGHHVLPRRLEAMKRLLRARVLRKAAAVVTWCDWAKRSLVDDYGIDENRIHVIAPGAAIEKFPFGSSPSADGGERPVRLLFVGGDFDRKGGQVLLQAYRAALRGRAELHLVTQQLLPSEEGVYVYNDLGPNSVGLLDLYRKADIFVLPTLGDCFPVVMGEAMAAGLPIVTTNVGALPEAVVHEVNGLVVPAGDDVALVSALNALISNAQLRIKMGMAGRRIAEARFDSRRNAERVLEVIKNVSLQQKVKATHEPQARSAAL